MSFDTIILFAGIVFLIAIIPGPNALLVLYTALTQGRRSAFSNLLGVSCGFLIHALISAKGLSLLLSQTSWGFNLLKYLGAAYLVYLGITSIRAGMNAQPIDPTISATNARALGGRGLVALWGSFSKGLLTNLLNPKIVLFYLSIFPQFVAVETVMRDSLLLGAIQALVVAGWFSLVILLAQRFKRLLSSTKVARRLKYLSGMVFLGFGAKLAATRL